MRERCFYEKHEQFRDYGGRGVTVCERWKSFDNFFADMGAAPSKDHSIDRYPNQDGNYEPGNCRWADRKQQNRNTKRNTMLEFRGETKCVAEWAEIFGLRQGLIRDRLKLGWSTEDAILTPVRTNRKVVT